MGRRNTASIHAESSDGECDDEDGDKDDDGDGDAGIHAEPSVGRREEGGIGCKRMPLEFANLAQAFIPQAIYLQLMPMVKLNSRFDFFSWWRGLELGFLQSQIL